MEALLRAQVFYEIAMSIGASLELKPMLKEALTSYAQKLSAGGIAIFENEAEKPLFSVPGHRAIKKNLTYQYSLKKRLQDKDTNTGFAEGHVPENDGYYYWFDLPKVGKLLLIRHSKPLDSRVRDSLTPINEKLAKAILACQQSLALQEMSKAMEEKNNKLAASEEELRQNIEELSTTQEKLEVLLNLANQQKESIVSSINYARHIQNALLSSHSKLKDIFSDYLHYFRARNIVSGDFLMLATAKTNDRGVSEHFLAVIDCTGHGVPAALITVVANNLLDRIINHDKICSPAKILSELDKHLMLAFRQHEKKRVINDGMDIALLRINTREGSVLFSGAKRPLWLMRAETGEIEQYKGERFSIGGYHGITKLLKKEFNEQEISVKTNDVLYLFSDGYPDQLSEQGKFLVSRFRKLLHQNFKKPFAGQHEILEHNFQEWKGAEEQTDDILIIGLRF